MKAYVCGSSALYYWRRDPCANLTLEDPCKRPLSDCPTNAQDYDPLRMSAYDFGPEPLRLMVSSKRERVFRKKYCYSVWSGSIPKGAFCNYGPLACVASPELCLLQAAQELSRFQLMDLCMEMLGYYSLDFQPPRGFGTRDFTLVTIKSLRQFAKAASGRKGSAQLAFILKYVAEGSRSPMETREFLLLCLPKRFGGYGLPRPKINAEIALTPAEQRKTKRLHLECDLLWEKPKIVIEFDGNYDHESRYDRARDAIKRETLIAKGYTVFTITSAQLLDEEVFDSVVRDIARQVGYRLKDFPCDWDLRHSLLREELFKSMDESESELFF